MVVLIDHDEATSGIDGNSGWTIKLTRAVTVGPEFSDERAVVAIDLYTIVGSIADYNVTFVIAN